MRLLHKELIPEKSEILYHEEFTDNVLKRDFEIRGGKWRTGDGWLIGENPDNCPGMVISKRNFTGNVMLDFKAATIPPCTHDINVMWNGSWNEEKNTRDVAYVAGIQGWWHGKVGFEKSPDYRLNVATQIFDFQPGKIYRVQAGSIDGHIFVIIDGKLVLEVTDPDPIDTGKYGRVGFEAYCSKLKFTDFYVKRPYWEAVSEKYQPEFS